MLLDEVEGQKEEKNWENQLESKDQQNKHWCIHPNIPSTEICSPSICDKVFSPFWSPYDWQIQGCISCFSFSSGGLALLNNEPWKWTTETLMYSSHYSSVMPSSCFLQYPTYRLQTAAELSQIVLNCGILILCSILIYYSRHLLK